MSLSAPPSSLWICTTLQWYRSLVLVVWKCVPRACIQEDMVVIVMSKNNIEGLMAAKDLPVGLAGHGL